jgi:predicted nicotinamide N-methyase
LKTKKNTISDLVLAPWTTSVLFAAIRLKIFSLLSNKKMTIDELASKCQAIPGFLKALMDACVSMGLVEYKNDTYMNSHFSQVYFVEGEPFYAGDFINIVYTESLQWYKLIDIIKGKKDVSEEKPSEIFNYSRYQFIKAMNNIGMLGEAEALKHTVDLSGCKEMIDAGGGSGLFSIALCQKFPGLKSTILDVNETLAVTKELIAGCKEKERITLRETDIIKNSFGQHIDAVLLSDVIYTESTAIPVLKNARNCLRQNGLLIIRGYYSDPGKSGSLLGALFFLKQLVDDPDQKIMTISSLKKNVSDSGFTITRVSPLTERSIVLIARK